MNFRRNPLSQQIQRINLPEGKPLPLMRITNACFVLVNNINYVHEKLYFLGFDKHLHAAEEAVICLNFLRLYLGKKY